MKKLLSLLVLAGVFFFNTGQLHAQDEAADEVMQEEVVQEEPVMAEEPTVEEAPAPRGFTQELKNRFIEGGPGFMGIVLACLIFGLAIAIERIIYLNLATTNTQKLTQEVEDAL
ncbi:MotA/TolQ/ExbB proton channel family protein, partial [Flavobacteriaceae bacterium]|nr:MotA/TolQ/ExbB proton channel family protein [Flavobacteriaceae bacterium]